MDLNKRRENAFDRLLANKPESIILPYIFGSSNQPRVIRMNDLGLQPRKVWKQPDRLPA
jgi:hypothetical protein